MKLTEIFAIALVVRRVGATNKLIFGVDNRSRIRIWTDDFTNEQAIATAAAMSVDVQNAKWEISRDKEALPAPLAAGPYHMVLIVGDGTFVTITEVGDVGFFDIDFHVTE